MVESGCLWVVWSEVLFTCIVLLELYIHISSLAISIVHKYILFRLEIVQIGNVHIGNIHIRLEMFRLEMFRLKARLVWKCQK